MNSTERSGISPGGGGGSVGDAGSSGIEADHGFIEGARDIGDAGSSGIAREYDI